MHQGAGGGSGGGDPPAPRGGPARLNPPSTFQTSSEFWVYVCKVQKKRLKKFGACGGPFFKGKKEVGKIVLHSAQTGFFFPVYFFCRADCKDATAAFFRNCRVSKPIDCRNNRLFLQKKSSLRGKKKRSIAPKSRFLGVVNPRLLIAPRGKQENRKNNTGINSVWQQAFFTKVGH